MTFLSGVHDLTGSHCKLRPNTEEGATTLAATLTLPMHSVQTLKAGSAGRYESASDLLTLVRVGTVRPPSKCAYRRATTNAEQWWHRHGELLHWVHLLLC
jgi:hypothetical protein